MAFATPITGIGASRIGQIAVTVLDLPRAEAFYKNVLGLRHLFSVNGQMAFFDCGARLMLGLPEAGQPPRGNSILYFQVGDIRAAHATLVSHGVKIVQAPHLVARMPDHELWLAFFEDSEGNTMSLMAEMRPAS
jgi:methylmalonyl-CoA/ethylmalonyl-CoA epimerase